jgi:hypothetical protein
MQDFGSYDEFGAYDECGAYPKTPPEHYFVGRFPVQPDPSEIDGHKIKLLCVVGERLLSELNLTMFQNHVSYFMVVN